MPLEVAPSVFTSLLLLFSLLIFLFNLKMLNLLIQS
jgi:hypothetical protein